MCENYQITCWLAFNDIGHCCCQYKINFKFLRSTTQNYAIQGIIFDFFIPYKYSSLFLVSDENTDVLLKCIKN